MSDSNKILTIIYWIIGIIIFLVILDFLWYKYNKEKKIMDAFVNELNKKHPEFYKSLPKYVKGKSVVLTLNNDDIYKGLLLITILKKSGLSIPIIVYHNDLNEENISKLQKYKVKNHKIDVEYKVLKIYALIYSPYEEVLLIDNDTLFINNPEYLFNDELYRHYGSLYWKDKRTYSYLDKIVYNWVKQLIPYKIKDNLILNKLSCNYQSSALLLFNKNNHYKTLEKLWVMLNNWKYISKYLSNVKEFFWIANELAQEYYTFNNIYPGVIGEKHMDYVYGHTLYFDNKNNFLCWDKSIFKNNNITDFTNYSLYTPESKWNIDILDNASLRNTEILPLTNEFMDIINIYIIHYHNIVNS